jgi:hypothetical protein
MAWQVGVDAPGEWSVIRTLYRCLGERLYPSWPNGWVGANRWGRLQLFVHESVEPIEMPAAIVTCYDYESRAELLQNALHV